LWLAERRRASLPFRPATAHVFLRAWLRYALAARLLAYGFAKVFLPQMPLPEPIALLTPYGRSSPMMLLWTFMGTSPTYEMLAGFAEVGAALLLFTDGAPLPDPYGIYDVEEMRRGDEIVPPLLTDPTYWRYVYFGRRISGIQLADGTPRTFKVSPGPSPETWSITQDGAAFTLTRSDDGHIRIDGVVDGRQVIVRARPTGEGNLRLVRSEFHWATGF
jgi:hypothetical protein